jgi:integrase
MISGDIGEKDRLLTGYIMATVKIKHLLRKYDCLYYQRRIPTDLKGEYPQSIIRERLSTDDLAEAAKLCAKYAARDNIKWQAIRSGADPEEAAQTALILRVIRSQPKAISLTDALARYLAEHKKGQDPRFIRDARRAIGFVTEAAGDLPLEKYTRDHARAVRDALMVGHSTGTVRRRIATVNAIFNLGRREFNIQCMNPFEKLAIACEGLDTIKRLPFTQDERQQIEQACRKMDDDIRHIIAIQLGTGARLRELVGLRREDIFLDCAIPYIAIRPNAVRGMKTPGSERNVPLLVVGLWGAKQALTASDRSAWLFPRYANDLEVRSDAASATINKFFSKTLNIPRTTHSFRHAMKDLLRDAGIPEEMSKAILGHGSRSVADQYGSGFSLQRKQEALERIK